MAETITLIVPPGAESAPISHGTDEFTPYQAAHHGHGERWLVDVPLDAAGPLLHNGGFKMVETAAQSIDDGDTVRLAHPDGPRGCGWNGVTYQPGEDGTVTVPTAAAGDLRAHGFRMPEEMATAKLSPAEQADAWSDEREKLKARIAELEQRVVELEQQLEATAMGDKKGKA